LHSRGTLHRWHTRIPGIPDTKGVTSDAKFASDAKSLAMAVRERQVRRKYLPPAGVEVPNPFGG